MRTPSGTRRTSWPLAFLAAFTLWIASAPPAEAAPGDLDPTFGGDGTVTTNFTRRADIGYPVALQADGKIVVAGEAGCCGGNPKVALARYDADGSLDTGFGDGGKVVTDLSPGEDVVFGLVVQPDGRIVAAGTAGFAMFALIRYEADGSLDTTFGTDGIVTTDLTPRGDYAYGLAMQPDGKLVLAGDAGAGGSRGRFAVARYESDGSLDTSFGGDGTVTTNITRYPDDGLALALESDGRIVVAGGAGFGGPNERWALVRYDTDGSLDSSFGTDGTVLTDFSPAPDVPFGLAIQPDGRIVTAGAARLGRPNTVWALARYETDGSLDATFGGDGTVTTDFTRGDDDAYSVALQADGAIVAAGQSGGANPRFAIARYEPDGELDPTFGDDGKLTTDFTPRYDSAYAVAIQHDGRIVACGTAGFARFAVARYDA